MPLSRRGLLKRMPALPFAVGAAVSQGPALLKGAAAALMPEMPTASSSAPVTMAQRLTWVRETLTWVNAPRPTLPMPEIGGVITRVGLRALVQWEIWEQYVAKSAVDLGVPLEDAQRIAQEVMGVQ